ncbi:MAG TPA: PQQ-dependent sugar dehydrogenase [Acidimicrobiia bacterium]|jgi:hypothetical protein
MTGPRWRIIGSFIAIVIASACGGSTGDGTTTAPGTGGSTGTEGGTTEPVENTTSTEPAAALRGLDLEVLAEGLGQPTFIVTAPGDDRLYIGERGGVVKIYDHEEGVLDEPFLNIPDRVSSNGIEQGMLGMAFHPDYQSNGRFFVYHVDRDQKRQLAEYHVSDDPNVADIEDAVALWDREQPPDSTDIRHYAGYLLFGPDGNLWVSSGDGAAGPVTGQTTDDYFGAILRFDVDSPANGEPFSTPDDNPFADEGGDAAAVWAYGLRNPWRFSIDVDSGNVFIADVGQANWEEVNVTSLESPGMNFGWATMEGKNCYIPSDCDPSGLTSPIYAYSHDDGCSITGGHVYRGAAIPEIQGQYFFADWCGEWIRSLTYEGGEAGTVRDWSSDLDGAGQVNAFGVGPDGELYIVNHAGVLAKIVPVR